MSFNFSDYKSDEALAAEVLFDHHPQSLLTFGFVSCIFFVIIGIPGNLITIVALATCKKFQNATAIFIINLHTSNLIFCCMILPMTAVNFFTQHWIFGKTMCSVYALMKYILNGTAHFTVVAITVNRYIIVCHPRVYAKLYKKRYLIISLLSTWVAAFVLFLPSFFGVWGRFDLEPLGGTCTMVPDKNNVSPKVFFLCLAFLGPYLIITVCYSRIWWVVRQTAKRRSAHTNHNPRGAPTTTSNSGSDTSVVENRPVCEPSAYESSTDDDARKLNGAVVTTPDGRGANITKFFKPSFRLSIRKVNKIHLPTRKDKKLATMILAILVSFTICHFPIMLTRVLYGEYKTDPKANVLVHLLDYSAAFISPIIYVLMSNEYRQAYIRLFNSCKENIVGYCNA